MKYSAPEKSSVNQSNQTQSEKTPSDLWSAARTIIKLQRQAPPIRPVPRDGDLPLSFAQERLWFLAQLGHSSSVYNFPAAFRLTGLLNVAALEQSLGEIVRRHEILRTTFDAVDGQPVQVISPDIALTLPVVDLRELPPNQRETEAQRQAIEEAQRPFDLAQEPGFRVKLLRLAQEEYILLLARHHIVFDGWSFGVFFRELAALYQTFSTGKPSPLPELPIQYADFAHWQRQWLQGEVLEFQLNYWKQQFRGSVPALQLPTEYPHPPVQTYRGASQSLELSKDLTEALNTLSQQEGVTLFITLLAAFKTLLYQYTRQEDIIFCSPVAGRNRIETKELIGYFNNILPMRTNLSGNPSFRELLGRVRQVALGAYQHQDLPFQKLADFPNLVRTPLSRGMFVLQNYQNQLLELPGITVSSFHVHKETSNFDLSLTMYEGGEKLTGLLRYKTDLFKVATITQMLGHFQTLLESLVANPEQRLGDLPLLTPNALPLTPNDQVDRRVLAALDQIRQEPEETFVAPRYALELQLTKIWEKVLGIQLIGVRDNFFDLGGHSLLAVRLSDQIQKAFNKILPLATIFQAPTVEQLARILRQKEWALPSSSLAAIQPSGSKPPIFLCEGVGIYYPLIPHLHPEQPVYGLVAEVGEGKPTHYNRMEELAAHYIEEMRTLQPEGPYFLGGVSWGGIVAFEMAQQLVVQGQKVALLAFFDTIKPGAYKPLPIRDRVSYHLSKLLQLGPTYVLEKVKGRIQEIKKRLSIIYDKFALEHELLMPKNLEYLAMREAYNQASRNYVPQVYPGQMTIFVASDRVDAGTYHVDPELGWGDLAAGGVEIYHIPGDHLGILKEPHVRVLAEKLQACIDKAQADD